VYSLYNFTISITNNNLNILTIYMYNICIELTIYNITTAGINYKELYDRKWDPMIHCIHQHLSFYKYFGLMMTCVGRN